MGCEVLAGQGMVPSAPAITPPPPPGHLQVWALPLQHPCCSAPSLESGEAEGELHVGSRGVCTFISLIGCGVAGCQ
ncbi:hypothetical protein HaLaN_12932 [Haematococcus lacustris]|uniref:Uncharacterized protein n=1 Tax=Haematococcus lacustris TaxID=44745 RepID=A0A699ZC73_HAELA|nr:hypothetical protein HaLaN_12932 [Haematococcus lacustris]